MQSHTLKLSVPAAIRLIPKRLNWRHNKGWMFVAPAVLLWLFVGLYPVVFSIILAFHSWNGYPGFSIFPTYSCILPTCRYVGLGNFTDFLTPNTPLFEGFTSALQHNFVLMIAVPVAVIGLALPLALAVDKAARGIRIFRTLLLLPMVTAGIAIYYVWSLIYQADGLLNSVFNTLGLSQLVVKNGWLGDFRTALIALVVVSVWSGVPFGLLLYLAGLQTISRDLIEAAIVDGANYWQRLTRVIWPLLSPVTVIIVITSLSGALQGYELPLLMTNGGPTHHTTVVGLLIYQSAFAQVGDSQKMGLASAYGWVLFILGLGLSVVALRSTRTLD